MDKTSESVDMFDMKSYPSCPANPIKAADDYFARLEADTASMKD
jgi:hypothetical protein